MKSGFLHALILHVLTSEEEEDEGEGLGGRDEEKLDQEGRESGADGALHDKCPNTAPVSHHYLPSIPLSPLSSLHRDEGFTAAGRDPFDYLQYSKDSDPSILADLLSSSLRAGPDWLGTSATLGRYPANLRTS
jgi:hypothetical protein